MKRVAVFNHFATPRGGPGGTRHVDLFGALTNWHTELVAADRNHFTRRQVPVDDGRRAAEEVTFHAVWTLPYAGNGPRRVLNWLSYAVTALVAGLRLPRPAVVVGSTPQLLAATSAWLVARARRVPFILEVRDLWPEILVEMGQLERGSSLHRMLDRLAGALARRADAVIVLTAGVGDALVAKGVHPTRVHLVPNGADPADFPPPADRAGRRRALGLEGIVVAYTGSHGPANGLDLALDAAAEIDDPEVHFLFVGDGPSKAALVERARRASLDNVSFRPPVAKQDMADLLGSVDVGLHVLADVALFAYGVSPNKLFDYLAAGLPVVTNTPGDVTDLVERAGAGIGVAPDGIADGVRQMVAAGEAGRAGYGDKGRALMAGEWSLACRAAALEQVLDAVSAAGRGRGRA